MRISPTRKSSTYCRLKAEWLQVVYLASSLWQRPRTLAAPESSWLGTEPGPDPRGPTNAPSDIQCTVHTSRMQKRARQVGQGTRLASQVSGRWGSWRLANHLPMQVRHHMGRQ